MHKKEFGSDFHFPIESKWLLETTQESFFNSAKFQFYFSGRSALYAIVAEGIKTKKWEKIYLPSYYCHEVSSFLKSLPIKIIYYHYNPFTRVSSDIEIEDTNTNVWVQVSYFGISSYQKFNFKNVVIIEDLSHNILAINESKADYCFGSLRKELPLPVGGFCYSKTEFIPKGTENEEANKIAAIKLEAMMLKSQYLKGSIKEKETFRRLFQTSELAFEDSYTNALMPKSSLDILFKLNVEKILKKKHENVKIAQNILEDLEDLSINISSEEPQNKPFGLLLKVSSNTKREALRNYLIGNNIYPAILWPNQFLKEDKEVENLVLFVHVDFRYTKEDITFAANKIKDFFNA